MVLCFSLFVYKAKSYPQLIINKGLDNIMQKEYTLNMDAMRMTLAEHPAPEIVEPVEIITL